MLGGVRCSPYPPPVCPHPYSNVERGKRGEKREVQIRRANGEGEEEGEGNFTGKGVREKRRKEVVLGKGVNGRVRREGRERRKVLSRREVNGKWKGGKRGGIL